MTEESQPKGVSRRTVAKGVAWAIPAIPLVVNAPAYAASPGCVTLGPDSCKYPGQSTNDPWGYNLVICNTCDIPITVTAVRKNTGPLYTTPALNVIFEPEDYAPANTIAPGECWELPVVYSSNSANFLEIDYNYASGGPTITIDKIESPPDCE